MPHSLGLAGSCGDRAPVTVPVQRAPGPLTFGSRGPVAFMPAVLLLAAAGRCSCPECVEDYVRARGRERLRLV